MGAPVSRTARPDCVEMNDLAAPGHQRYDTSQFLGGHVLVHDGADACQALAGKTLCFG